MEHEAELHELAERLGGRWLIEGAPDDEIPPTACFRSRPGG